MLRAFGLWAMLVTSCIAAPQDAAWEHFKSRFISSDGRVLDPHQGSVSHSEGQAYAMLLAQHFNDRRLFDELWLWTRNNLQVRHDALVAWNWGRRVNGEWIVADYNNATDGDTLIAYALLKAAESWGEPSYARDARKIIEAIRKHLAVSFGEHLLLLPGYTGFADANGFSFNPSYFVPTAYHQFAVADDLVFWQKATAGSRFLLQRACANRFGLPADWLTGKGGTLLNDEKKSGRFGYEAIRVFLYASWDKEPYLPCKASVLFDEFREHGRLPAWIHLSTGEKATLEASGGFYAVLASAAGLLGMPGQAQHLRQKATARLAGEPDDYYSYALFLLAQLAV